MAKHDGKFPGFPPKPVTNFWPYPKALNGWWSKLSGSEQKCVDYILRHTWGYNRVSDSISHSQFIKGIIKYDGTILDGGTGIKNEKTVRKALKGLVEKGFIERLDRSNLGKESIYKLSFDSTQETVPLPNIGTPALPNSGSPSSQSLVPTIDNIHIDNYNISATQKSQKTSYKEEIDSLTSYLGKKLGGVRFPNGGKQAKYIKLMLDDGYTTEDITWAIDKLYADEWWGPKGFDMKSVADEIPKLMVRNKKTDKENSKPIYIPCNQNGCDNGYIVQSQTGRYVTCKCREEYNRALEDWKSKWK